jgi:hypothetical protein
MPKWTDDDVAVKNVRIWVAVVTLAGSLMLGPAVAAQDDEILPEDAVAFLIGFRDMAIFQERATVQLDHRFVEGIGITTELYKVGPGNFIAPLCSLQSEPKACHQPLKAGSGFFGTSIRRVEGCQFEERNTVVGEVDSIFSELGGMKVYDFSNASFEIIPGEGGQWALKVMGKNVFCFGRNQPCVNETKFTDVTVTPNEDARAQKAKDLDRIVAYFQAKLCPGATR